jgi:hypothetical protein
MPKLKTPVNMTEPPAIPNIHPVDELHAIREEIAQLQDRADTIRDGLLATGVDLIHGDQHTAKIIEAKRETLDKKALIEAFGEKIIAPYIKSTVYKTVKIVEN